MSFDQARMEIVAACRELADRGYLAGTGGNLAYRIDEEHFAITPSATDYYAMEADDICVLRLDDLTRVEGTRKPSVEHKLHAHLFLLHHDCRASIHTHQPVASAYTLLGRGARDSASCVTRCSWSQGWLCGLCPFGNRLPCLEIETSNPA